MVEKDPQDSVQKEQFDIEDAVENTKDKNSENQDEIKPEKKESVKPKVKETEESAPVEKQVKVESKKENSVEETTKESADPKKESTKKKEVEDSKEDKAEVVDTSDTEEETSSKKTKVAKKTKESIPKEEKSKSKKKDTEEEKKDEPKEEKSEEEKKETEAEVKEKTEEEKKEAKPTKDEKLEERLSVDYTNFSKADLVTEVKQLLGDFPLEKVKDNIENLKVFFYKKHKADIEKEKKKFLEEDGLEEDFKPSTESENLEKDLKRYLDIYKKAKVDYINALNKEKENNLKEKYAIIEEIKDLVNREESINKTFNEFRALQQRWHDAGQVPQQNLKNLWDTYNHNVEVFYDYIKINKDLKDLDLKKNLETKIGLCEKAEELLLEPSVIKAFNTLQKYHDKWRECGPAPHENREELWERFKAITSKINKKHQQFFVDQKENQKKNLEEKELLCEKIEELTKEEYTTPKEWDNKSKELIEIQQLWKTIGYAPKKDNNKIYKRFRKACDAFFAKKREYFKDYKSEQEHNLQLKTSLCVQAEALKDESSDWKNTTNEFINLQKKWKEIGSVPKKYSDKIWKRFRAACNEFFENKSKHFASAGDRYKENLEKKEALIKKITDFKLLPDVKDSLGKLKEFQREWSEIGFVANNKKDEVQHKYREAINEKFDKLDIGEKEKNSLKFKSHIEAVSSKPNSHKKLGYERDKLFNRLKTLESDIHVLENNIGFFSNSKGAESMIKGVEEKIEKARKEINEIKAKIDMLDNMES